MSKKKIGIIGGMGPLATVKLFENIVNCTYAEKDQDHVPLIIENNINIPDRTDYIIGRSKEDPLAELVISAQNLERVGADFIIMACNTAHFFFEDICKNVSIECISMVEETAKYLKEKDIKTVGLLATEGTIRADIYGKVLSKYGIKSVSPLKSDQEYITEVIYNIKKGKLDQDLTKFNHAIINLKNRGVNKFIAACTEISVATEIYDLTEDIVDPMKILARESVLYAGGKLKKDCYKKL